MIDEKLYRETFSRLQASGEAKKEVLLKMNEMNEKKMMRRPLKVLRAAGLAAMLTVALAVSANAASGGELLESIFQTFVVTCSTPDGSETFTVNVTDGVSDSVIEGLFSPEHGAAVTEKRNDRLYLIIDGTETDITDALNEDGQYTAALEDGTTITVQGTVEDHMILSSAQGSDMYYITTGGTGGDMDALNSAKTDMGEADGVTAVYEPMAADAPADENN